MLTAFARDADMLVPFDTASPDFAVQAPAILWVDILRPDRSDADRAASLFGVSIPTLEEMKEIELSARLFEEDGAQFMTATIVSALDSDAPLLSPITFILKGAVLLTVRHTDSLPFDTVRNRRLRTNGATSAETIMLSIVEAIVDRIADALERIAGQCDAVSREVFAAKAANSKSAQASTDRDLEATLGRIGREGDLLTKLRESLVGLTRLLSYHSAREAKPSRTSREPRQLVKTLQRDLQSLTDHASFLSSKINFLLDATLGLINLEQNQIIKIFTVAAVAFLPPTLIASIYGMNFNELPELHWRYGYPFAIGLMLLSAALPFLYFRKRGWL